MRGSILNFAACGVAVLLGGARANAGVIAEPPGVAPGQPFIVLIETSGTTTAASTDITTYNGFVQSAIAAAGLNYHGSAGTWSVFGATQAVNNVTPLTASSVPVFNVNGQAIVPTAAKLVNNSAFLSAPDITELGTFGGGNVWTGIFANSGGVTATSSALGDTNVTAGTPTGTTSNSAFSSALGPNTLSEHLYGFATFTSVPEPGTAALWALAAIAGLGRRRRRMMETATAPRH